MVVVPSNAQARRLREALRVAGLPDVPVGSADKFQGREAPVAFCSMAPSSEEDMPRTIGFLSSRSRLDVRSFLRHCACAELALYCVGFAGIGAVGSGRSFCFTYTRR